MIMEANTMNPYQSDPKGAILSGSFAINVPKNTIRQEDEAKMTGGKRVKFTEMSWAEQF